MKDLSLFGIYVAPISVLLAVSWVVTVLLRRLADRYGLLHHAWHPPLLVAACYVVVLSVLVLFLFHWQPPG